jgi:hypothetical protein
MIETCHDIDQCCFSALTGTQNDHEFIFCHFQRNIFQNLILFSIIFKGFGYMLTADHRFYIRYLP